LARAEQLRELAADFDVVVVHAHPFDVVPAIAFAGLGGPPIVLLNHASFAFWVGRDAADVVACLRPSSRDVAINRRGIHPSRCPLLPIPVERPAQGPTRSEARAALGVPRGAVLLFTVASPYKYLPFEAGPSFVELIVSVALAHDRARVLAIGPTDEGAWREARERTGGRIRALGSDADVDLHARAADVYLDSFPLTSPTSFLEVGRYGAPIVSLNSYARRAAVLCADDARPEGLFVRVSPDTFVGGVGRLVEDAPYRKALGRATADAVLGGHGPEAFAKSLRRLRSRGYARAPDPWRRSRSSRVADECLVRMQKAAGAVLARRLRSCTDAFPPEFRQSVRLQSSIEVDSALTCPRGWADEGCAVGARADGGAHMLVDLVADGVSFGSSRFSTTIQRSGEPPYAGSRCSDRAPRWSPARRKLTPRVLSCSWVSQGIGSVPQPPCWRPG
jgi:hypothetical protein